MYMQDLIESWEIVKDEFPKKPLFVVMHGCVPVLLSESIHEIQESLCNIQGRTAYDIYVTDLDEKEIKYFTNVVIL